MLSDDQEKAIVLLAFANGQGKDEAAPGSVAQALFRVGRDCTNVSHADFIRLQGKVERLNRVLNDNSYNGVQMLGGCDAGQVSTKR